MSAQDWRYYNTTREKHFCRLSGTILKCVPRTVGEQDERHLQHSPQKGDRTEGQEAGMPARFCE